MRAYGGLFKIGRAMYQCRHLARCLSDTVEKRAGVPNSVGSFVLPLEGVGLILAVDRVLDMCRTSVNVWSDTVGAAVISRWEGAEGADQ